jgi:flagellum-specific ATP synthase
VSLLEAQIGAVNEAMPYGVRGSVQSVGGLTIEASDLALPLGSLCRIHGFDGKSTLTEVIGFQGERTLLMALEATGGVSHGDRIENIPAGASVGCSMQLLGRVLNGFGKPIDGKGSLPLAAPRRLDTPAVQCMDRTHIDKPIATSVRAIDGLLTCGLGQRMGIFSGPGVGKSLLLSQIAKHTSADVSVVALIGERGREVNEFLKHNLGDVGLRKCVVIVSTGDEAPLLRVRAAKIACTVAEFFRDQGRHVLLLIDSLTRLAQAQRQIGLAAREPPATKGFPPSVFALLPQILERAGKTARGSVTGFYTVLVEADDFNEPIADAVKGISDGHLWLNRALANRGHYPAIDVLQSISRVRSSVADAEQVRQARRILALMAAYQDIEDLVNIGAYVAGTSMEFDLAVQARPRILQFLQQEFSAPTTMPQAQAQLKELHGWIEQSDRAIRAHAAKKAKQ